MSDERETRETKSVETPSTPPVTDTDTATAPDTVTISTTVTEDAKPPHKRQPIKIDTGSSLSGDVTAPEQRTTPLSAHENPDLFFWYTQDYKINFTQSPTSENSPMSELFSIPISSRSPGSKRESNTTFATEDTSQAGNEPKTEKRDQSGKGDQG